ncbi:unnamed protein product [Discosporangium mesarthrocarpum]
MRTQGGHRGSAVGRVSRREVSQRDVYETGQMRMRTGPRCCNLPALCCPGGFSHWRGRGGPSAEGLEGKLVRLLPSSLPPVACLLFFLWPRCTHPPPPTPQRIISTCSQGNVQFYPNRACIPPRGCVA